MRASPAAPQSLGMAVHDLTINAVKYGALSNDTDRVQITWQLSREAKLATGFAMTCEEQVGDSDMARRVRQRGWAAP